MLISEQLKGEKSTKITFALISMNLDVLDDEQ